MEAATLDIDRRDIDDIVEKTKRREGLNHHDAEEAVATAALKLLEQSAEGEEFRNDPGRLVARSRLYASNLRRKRERGNASLDAAREDDVDRAPVELAVDEVDFDLHAEVTKLDDHPVLRRRLEAVRAGATHHFVPRGSSSPVCQYGDADVTRAKQLREEGLTLKEVAEIVGCSESSVSAWCCRRRRVCSTEGWTRELAIFAMKLFAEEEGRRPKWTDFRGDQRLPSSFPLNRIFGKTNTLRKALEAAGFEIEAGPGVAYSDGEIKSAILGFIETKGRPPKWREWRAANGLPSPHVLYDRFGTAKVDVILNQLEGSS